MCLSLDFYILWKESFSTLCFTAWTSNIIEWMFPFWVCFLSPTLPCKTLSVYLKKWTINFCSIFTIARVDVGSVKWRGEKYEGYYYWKCFSIRSCFNRTLSIYVQMTFAFLTIVRSIFYEQNISLTIFTSL